MNTSVLANLPAPENHGSLGEWLKSFRQTLKISGSVLGSTVGVSPQSVYMWEKDRYRPRLRFLRTLKEGFQLPQHQLVTLLTTFYFNPDSRTRTREPTEPFWQLIATKPGSLEEQRLRNDLITTHQGIATAVARRFGGYREIDDLRQEALIGLAAAIPGYIPSMGPFRPYAAKFCRGRVLQYLSDCWYVDVPMELRRPYTVVRKAIQRIWQQSGQEPTDAELVEHLDQPMTVVRGARGFLARKGFSLDASRMNGAQTMHDVVGRTPSAFAEVELRVDLQRTFADVPGASEIVIAHFIHDIPPLQIAERTGQSIESIRTTVETARTKLQASGRDRVPWTWKRP